METRYHDATGHIDHEAVKDYALELRRQAIDAAWKQLVSGVSGWIAGLRLDAPSPVGEPGAQHFGRARHRPG